ncbi:MAG: helix-turn-helix transcriptional regulator [Ktedonobacteraceae bacterium]|nr:helix-turn-helix transcriptional regulator [Ktedonobacteraceae bacterium]
MQDPQTWRELLGRLIKDPQKKQTIAGKLGVSPLTLTRWVSGESTPRSQNLRQLLAALPDQRKRLLDLLAIEFDPLFIKAVDTLESPREIPSTLYARVLSAHANLPRSLRFKSVSDMVLQQAIEQFDPCCQGIEITVVQCMPPGLDGRVRSLRESIGRGTPPWDRELEQRTLFLGSETLAGYSVSAGRALAVQRSGTAETLFPSRWAESEESAMAHPIMWADRVSGCLLVSSTQPDFFLSPNMKVLVQRYAELLSILCEPSEFHALHDIDLASIPSFDAQRPYIAAFRSRVSTIMQQSQVTVLEAENMAWQQIEEILIRLSSSTRRYSRKGS